MNRNVFASVIVGCLVIAALVETVHGGPPFMTDDPEPVDYKHWEFYIFSTLDNAPDGTEVEAPAVELNYGVLPNTQAHIVFPLANSIPEDEPSAFGAGDMELGLKYRFVEETEDTPQIGIFPMLMVPTGDSSRELGNGKAWVKFPVWVQKSCGQWTTYAGGGYAFNSAGGQRDYPFGGWLLQKEFGESLRLAGEIFAEGKTEDEGQDTVLANFGGYYTLMENFDLLFSVGHSIADERHVIGYLGLYWTW